MEKAVRFKVLKFAIAKNACVNLDDSFLVALITVIWFQIRNFFIDFINGKGNVSILFNLDIDLLSIVEYLEECVFLILFLYIKEIEELFDSINFQTHFILPSENILTGVIFF